MVRVTRRGLLGAGLGAAGLFGVAACGGSSSRSIVEMTVGPLASPVVEVPGFDDSRRWAGQTLRIGMWGGQVQDALREAVLQPFAAATGAAIVEVPTDYHELAASVERGEPYADVLLVDPIWVRGGAARGLLHTPEEAELVLDPGLILPDGVSVPAYAMAMVSGFRMGPTAWPGEPENWAAWWDRDRFSGHRTLPRDPLGTFEIALLAEGVERDALYPLDGLRALDGVRRISGRVIDNWWDTRTQSAAWLSRGRADLALAWHDQIMQERGKGHAVSWNWNEGLLLTDRWIMSNGSKVSDCAVDFLKFAVSPEMQAALSRRYPVGPVLPAAFDHLSAAERVYLPTAPGTVEKLVPVDTDWWSKNRGVENAMFQSWLLGEPFRG